MAHLEPENTIQVADGAHDSLPLIQKTRLARNVVSERHHAHRASERTCGQHRSTSCTMRRQQRPLEGLRQQRRQKPTPLSPLQVFDICMAIYRARHPSVHRRTPCSQATSHLRARAGQSLRAQASMLARRRSATRRLGAMRQGA